MVTPGLGRNTQGYVITLRVIGVGEMIFYGRCGGIIMDGVFGCTRYHTEIIDGIYQCAGLYHFKSRQSLNFNHPSFVWS